MFEQADQLQAAHQPAFVRRLRRLATQLLHIGKHRQVAEVMFLETGDVFAVLHMAETPDVKEVRLASFVKYLQVVPRGHVQPPLFFAARLSLGGELYVVDKRFFGDDFVDGGKGNRIGGRKIQLPRRRRSRIHAAEAKTAGVDELLNLAGVQQLEGLRAPAPGLPEGQLLFKGLQPLGDCGGQRRGLRCFRSAGRFGRFVAEPLRQRLVRIAFAQLFRVRLLDNSRVLKPQVAAAEAKSLRRLCGALERMQHRDRAEQNHEDRRQTAEEVSRPPD